MRSPLFTCKSVILLAVVVLPACAHSLSRSTPTQETIISTAPFNLTQSDTPGPSPASPPVTTPLPGWYHTLPASRDNLLFQYALVSDPQAKVYNSLQDALKDSSHFTRLPSAPGYVAYTGVEVLSDQTFYILRYGKTMRAEDLQPAAYSSFSGILIEEDVDFRFGWVLSETVSGDASGLPLHTYSRYQLVQESTTDERRSGFIAVGSDEWLPESSLAMVDPALPPEAGLYSCRFIYVDLSEQILSAYDDCRPIFATLVSSGQEAGWTRAGEFAVLFKMEYRTTSSDDSAVSPYYLESVPYFMTYFGEFGIHAAYWHDQFGFPVSHGCINLSPADTAWLYAWARLGERVFISNGY